MQNPTMTNQVPDFMLRWADREARLRQTREAIVRLCGLDGPESARFLERPTVVQRPTDWTLVDAADQPCGSRTLWVVDTTAEAGQRGSAGHLEFSTPTLSGQEDCPWPRVGDLVLFWRRGRRGGAVSLCSISMLLMREMEGSSQAWTRYRAQIDTTFTFPEAPVPRRKLGDAVEQMVSPVQRIPRAIEIDENQVEHM